MHLKKSFDTPTNKMNFYHRILILSCFTACVSGHGRMIEPPQRSSLWRMFPGKGFEPNYNDNELFCGGFNRQWNENDGKCGTCGDPYDGERQNEAGGKYATGFIARRYKKGQDIDVEIQLTANHLGSFQFKLCPQNDITTQVTQTCLDRHVLEIAGKSGVTKYEAGSKIGSHYLKIKLPADVTCEQCVLQWHYTAGNNNNCDKITGECCKGCGPQETFINCADIAIEDDGNAAVTTAAPATTPKPTTQPQPTTSKPKPTLKPTTTSKPTTQSSLKTTVFTGTHVTSCGQKEELDCIGVGVFEGLGYESWCYQHCSAKSVACTSELCRCRCKTDETTCSATDAYKELPGLDDWCEVMCKDGCDDLSHICQCI